MGGRKLEQIKKIKHQKDQRKKQLLALKNKPFHKEDNKQQQQLIDLINHFEFNVNLMRVFQFASFLPYIWGAGKFTLNFIPFSSSLSAMIDPLLLIGLNGYILERFRENDFQQEVEEMEDIYRWIMEENMDEPLKNLEVQRLIELLAPLTSPAKIIIWKKDIKLKEHESNSLLSNMINGIPSLVSNISSFPTFFSAKKEDGLSEKSFKKRIEEWDFQEGNCYEEFKKAIQFFLSPRFRSMAANKSIDAFHHLFSHIQETIPVSFTKMR